MSDDTLNRRGFVSALSGGLGGLWLGRGAAVEETRAYAASVVAGEPAALEFFTGPEAADVAAIAACIIPTDEAAGAAEAGVGYFIDRWLARHETESKGAYTAGLADLDRRVKQRHPAAASFGALPEPEQVALLTEIERGDFFALVRMHSIMGFLGSPAYGGNRGSVGWKAVGFDNRGIWRSPFGWYDREGNHAR